MCKTRQGTLDLRLGSTQAVRYPTHNIISCNTLPSPYTSLRMTNRMSDVLAPTVDTAHLPQIILNDHRKILAIALEGGYGYRMGKNGLTSMRERRVMRSKLRQARTHARTHVIAPRGMWIQILFVDVTVQISGRAPNICNMLVGELASSCAVVLLRFPRLLSTTSNGMG